MPARKHPDFITAYMRYVEDSEPPLLYHKWMSVGAITSVLKRKCWLQWGMSDTIYPNMYIVLVGPAGKCRKGTAMGAAKDLLRTLGLKIAPTAITREALIKELEDTTDQQRTSTGTYVTHSSLSIWSPEWSVFLGGKDNVPMLMALTDWYDCDDIWTYTTKSQGTNEIQGVWVNMIGATTPQQIKTTMSLDAVGGGLVSRIVFVYEEDRAKIVPLPTITPELEKLKIELIHDLGRIHSLSGEFQMTQVFKDKYINWYMKMDQTNPKMSFMFDGYINRRQTHLRKLCMVMSASRGDDLTLSEHDFDRALKLLTATEVKMARTFAGVGTSKDSQLQEDLMRYIARKGKVAVAEIYQDFQGFITSKPQLKELLELLVDSDFCTSAVQNKNLFITFNPKSPLADRYKP